MWNTSSPEDQIMKLSHEFLSCFTSYIKNQAIGLMSRAFANGPGDQGSIPGPVIPKTHKMILDASLLNTPHYKVKIKGKV